MESQDVVGVEVISRGASRESNPECNYSRA